LRWCLLTREISLAGANPPLITAVETVAGYVWLAEAGSRVAKSVATMKAAFQFSRIDID
jgi:hypothetical protein